MAIAGFLLLPGALHAATVQLPIGHQVNDDSDAGIHPSQSVSGVAPTNANLAAGSLVAGKAETPWAIFRQTTPAGGHDQVFVRSYASGAWTTRGRGTVGGVSSTASTYSGSLNFNQGQDGKAPAIDFAGDGRTVPWATWSENTPGSGFNADQVFAARYDGITGDANKDKWIFEGQGRGTGSGTVPIPSLNIHPSDNADNPAVAGGSTNSGGTPVPWITWQETEGSSSQIFVAKAVTPTTAPHCPPAITIPGDAVAKYCWSDVGTERVGGTDPSLDVDPTRFAFEPDIAFAGAGDNTPWITWYEAGSSATTGLSSSYLVFAAKAVQDPTADGGFHWQVVGRGTAGLPAQTLDATGGPCTAGSSPANGVAEAKCAMNADPTVDAAHPRIAAGTMTPGQSTVPWVVWSEDVNNTTFEIFVARLAGDHFQLVNGGKPISSTSEQAAHPDITFAGNTPYVSWVSESDGQTRQFLGHFVNATSPKFVLDNGPLSVTPLATADVRAPIASACAANPSNGDGSNCQGNALGTPFSVRTTGTTTLALIGAAYQPGKPIVSAPTSVGTTTATAHGAVNPGGAAVIARFDYGTTTKYGKATSFQLLGPKNASTPISAKLTGVAAGKPLHYRLEVRTDFGTTFSADRAVAPPHASKLTISRGSNINAGKVTVKTKLTDGRSRKPLGHRKVTLFERHGKSGAWHKVATKTTSAKGKAEAKVRVKVGKAVRCQWRFGGDKTHKPSRSKTLKIVAVSHG